MTLRTWWEFINDLWRFIKKHHAHPRNWKKLMTDASVIDKRHKGTKAILFAVIEMWENEDKEIET